MNKIITVEHLSKSYGSVQAVKDISFYVEKGKLFAFLGTNGAGKSTTINMICTFLKNDAGRVSVDEHELGKNDEHIRESIGIVFQENLMDPLLTVKENLLLRGSFYYKKKEELIKAFDEAAKVTEIQDFIKRPYGKLSGGQRRRVDIARALLHTPKILFLDEPTTGLDPQTRKTIWDTIKKLQTEREMTIFLTTHYMEEADDADYCIVIDEGQIAAKGTPFELKDQYAKDNLKIKAADEVVLKEILKMEGFSWREQGGLVVVELNNTKQALDILNKTADHIESFTVEKGKMDDVFIGITGKEIRE